MQLFDDVIECRDNTASVTHDRMSKEHQWKDCDRAKTKVVGGKHVAVPLCVHQICHMHRHVLEIGSPGRQDDE